MFINYEFLRSSILNKILALIFVLIFPIHAYAGFPEGENGYELKKVSVKFFVKCSNRPLKTKNIWMLFLCLRRL